MSNIVKALLFLSFLAASKSLLGGQPELLSEAPRKAPLHAPEIRKRALMKEAEAALSMGQAKRAAELFEQAASQFGESPEAEIGQVRAHMQAGEFREAIAFANLVVGEHSDSNEALALLAFLEDREGQTEKALAKLRSAREKYPEDVSLLGAMAEILIDRLDSKSAAQILDQWIAHHPPQGDIYRLRARAALARGHLDEIIHWRAKAAQAYEAAGEINQAKSLRDWLSRAYGEGSSADRSVPAKTEASAVLPSSGSSASTPLGRWPAPFVEPMPPAKHSKMSLGNGFIVDQGRRIVTHARVVAGSQGDIEVRNGLGKVRKARLESLHEDQGLAILRLETPYDGGWSVADEKFAKPEGVRFCFVLGFPVADVMEAGTPAMAPGIVFRADTGVAGLMQITSALGRDHSGSPVFDNLGRLIGIVHGKLDPIEGVKDVETQLGGNNLAIRADRLKPLMNYRRNARKKKGVVAQPLGAPSPEELYERLRPVVVTVAAQSKEDAKTGQ